MTEDASPPAAPIGVIIPCYNYGHFLGQTIESVLSQTVRPVELIVVDDGSTDNTRDVCVRFPEARYIWQENGGVSSARNRGIQESTAPYLMFPDSDDVLLPNAIETLWDARQQAPSDVKALFGWADVFSDAASANPAIDRRCYPMPEELAEYIDRKITANVWLLSDHIVERLIKANIVPQCAAIIERSVYEDIGWWDCRFRYHQDRDIWVKIAARFPVCFVNAPVASIRRHDDNITHNKNWIRNHFEILELLDSVAHANWAPPYLKALARARYASGAYLLAQRLGEQGDLREARRLMASAFFRKPIWAKPAVRWLEYLMRGLAARK